MENEKVLRLRISAEKWGPKSKFGHDNPVDNRLSFPTHRGSTSVSKNCMLQLAARARQNSGLVTPYVSLCVNFGAYLIYSCIGS